MSLELYKQKILTFYTERKRMPSYSEIMSLLGFKSKNAVFKVVHGLIDLGVLRKDKQGKLIPLFGYNEVPLLGLVEAGLPSSGDIISDTIDFDEYLVQRPGSTFVLKVKGDSMIEEGIREGDLVVVEKKSARVGDIVIAYVDGGWTMKFLRKDKTGASYLEPANSKYKPIYPEQELEIGAVVTGVVRRY